MAANRPTITIDRFAGVNNRDEAREVGLSAFVAGANCDITRRQKIRRRPGASRIYVGPVDAAWFEPRGLRAPLFQSGEALYELLPDYGARLLAEGLSRVNAGDLVGTTVNGRTYLTNGRQALVVEETVRGWGLPRITPQPIATATSGALRAGRYQIAVTLERADGQEGGTGLATILQLPDRGGFTLTDLPTHPEATRRNVYLSGADGEALRRLHRLGATETTWTYRGDGARLGAPLRTQFTGPPPAGQVIAYHLGRLFVADGRYLYESDPYHPELFDPRRYVVFESAIQIVAPVLDGLYVGTETETVFLGGADAGSFRRVHLADYGAIRGTVARIAAQHIGEGSQRGEAAIWASPRGFCAGFAGGAFTNLTDRVFDVPASLHGAAAIRTGHGQFHFLSTVNALS